MSGQWRPGGKSNHEIGGDTVASVLRGALGVREACKAAGLAPEQQGAWARAFRRTALRAFDDGLRLALGHRAWESEGLGATEFCGPIAELSVMDLVQSIALGRRDGVIAVAHDGAESRLWCVAGEIVDAESGALVGEAAVYRVLALERGQVSAELCTVQRERSVQRPTPALLLEAARRLDERERLRGRFAGMRFVSARAGGSATGPAQAALLTLLESPLGLPDLLATSSLGEYDTLRTLAALIDARHVVLAAEEGGAASALSMRPVLEGPATPLRRASRPRLAAALAVGAVAAAVAVALVAGREASAPAAPATSEPEPRAAVGRPEATSRQQTLALNDVPERRAAPARPSPAPQGSGAGAMGTGAAVAGASPVTPSAVAAATVTAPLPSPPAAEARPRPSRDAAPSRTPSPEVRATRSQPSASERPTDPLVPRMRIIEERVPHMQIVE